MLAQISEIVVVIPPQLCAMDAVLTDYPEALVACPGAGYARSLSADATPSPDLMLFDYRTAGFATHKVHSITPSASR
jgi:hypothetical protein